jgi:SAM-dependent methyltransferase
MPVMKASFPCPLCGSDESFLLCERNDSGLGARPYFRCPGCALVFLSPAQHLSPVEEKKRYDAHQNDPADGRYREFLSRLARPLSVRLRAGASGLDFGCGPGPAMSRWFSDKGFTMEDYDPVYRPQPLLLEQTYDFITCSETAEHFHNPGREFLQLDRLLKPGGFLGVMTQMFEDEKRFETWWYPKDPTHVCFYQRQTFEWIAAWRRWEAAFPAPNIAIFQKLCLCFLCIISAF